MQFDAAFFLASLSQGWPGSGGIFGWLLGLADPVVFLRRSRGGRAVSCADGWRPGASCEVCRATVQRACYAWVASVLLRICDDVLGFSAASCHLDFLAPLLYGPACFSSESMQWKDRVVFRFSGRLLLPNGSSEHYDFKRSTMKHFLVRGGEHACVAPARQNRESRFSGTLLRMRTHILHFGVRVGP